MIGLSPCPAHRRRPSPAGGGSVGYGANIGGGILARFQPRVASRFGSADPAAVLDPARRAQRLWWSDRLVIAAAPAGNDADRQVTGSLPDAVLARGPVTTLIRPLEFSLQMLLSAACQVTFNRRAILSRAT